MVYSVVVHVSQAVRVGLVGSGWIWLDLVLSFCRGTVGDLGRLMNIQYLEGKYLTVPPAQPCW